MSHPNKPMKSQIILLTAGFFIATALFAADPPPVGNAAPEFSLPDAHGKTHALADYKGKALLINFWATWCGPCKVETPWIVDLRNQYAAKGFEVLGVSTDDIDRDDSKAFGTEKKEIADFVQRMHMPYPVLIEGDKLSKPYGGLDAMPTSFFVDRNGKIVAATMGISSKDDIEANIKKALILREQEMRCHFPMTYIPRWAPSVSNDITS